MIVLKTGTLNIMITEKVKLPAGYHYNICSYNWYAIVMLKYENVVSFC